MNLGRSFKAGNAAPRNLPRRVATIELHHKFSRRYATRGRVGWWMQARNDLPKLSRPYGTTCFRVSSRASQFRFELPQIALHRSGAWMIVAQKFSQDSQGAL